jgi:hypothetical protein
MCRAPVYAVAATAAALQLCSVLLLLSNTELRTLGAGHARLLSNRRASGLATTTAVDHSLSRSADLDLAGPSVTDSVDTDDERQHIAALEKHQCIQDALHREMGNREHPELRWLLGCMHAPVVRGFASWADEAGCGGGGGDETVGGRAARQALPVRVHVSVHPGLKDWERCLAGFVSSWHESQPAGSSVLSVWVMGGVDGTDLVADVQRALDRVRDNDPHRSASDGGGARNNTITVHDVTTVQNLANATALSCVTAAMWSPPARDDADRARVVAELLRLVVLHNVGGVWFDLCTVLLAPLQPVLRHVDEFGVMRGMSPHYSTVALALRSQSRASAALLELVCRCVSPVSLGCLFVERDCAVMAQSDVDVDVMKNAMPTKMDCAVQYYQCQCPS